jgi:2-polyprenyl-6-methoxyphenol hydroxylase-like FAD-dependent oxidoreductase
MRFYPANVGSAGAMDAVQFEAMTSRRKRRRIAIIGAGPAGLTAAIAARRFGLDAEVFEQAPDFKPIGGGILMHSNGQRALDALDVLEPFRPNLCLTTTMSLRLRNGRRISDFDYSKLPVPCNAGAVVMRYTLQDHLLREAERLGAPVRFGRRCEGAEIENGRVVLAFAGGNRESFDVAVAADGVHSAIRTALGLPVRKIAIGEAYLRGISARPLRDPSVIEIWGEDGRRFGLCSLTGGRTYFFCSVPLGRWNEIRNGSRSSWVDSWKDWGPDVHETLREVADWNAVNYDELKQVDLGTWTRPPVFLIGDAAHAMTPNLGQGGNSAIVDALILMRLLGRGGPLPDVAREFEEIRRPFVTKIQKTARLMGRVASLTSPVARTVRNSVLGMGMPESTGLLLAGYNPKEERCFGVGAPAPRLWRKEARGVFPPRPVPWALKPLSSAETSSETLPDGRVRLRIRHPRIRGVTPAMLAWWFRNIEGTISIGGRRYPRYHIWHPVDHILFEVARRGSDGSVGPGARFHIVEAFGGDPANLIDVVLGVEKLDEEGIVLSRRALRLHHRFTPVDGGTQYDTELTAGISLFAPLTRRIVGHAFPEEKRRAWLRHNVEEVGTFEEFLPDLYRERNP